MHQREIYVEVAKSKRSISGATVAGFLFADPKSSVGRKSARAVGDSVFNTQQRTYKRKKMLWVCSDCSPKIKSGEVQNVWETIGSTIIILLVIFILIAVF